MTPTRTEVERIIARHLTEVCGVSPDSLSDGSALFSDGLLDSLHIVGLVAFMEREFGVAIGSFDISIEHFDSLRTLGDFICSRAGIQT